jgi:Protein of unknown function (DUF3352)
LPTAPALPPEPEGPRRPRRARLPIRSRGRARGACAIPLALATALLASCGSGGSTGTSADPASAVPASAALYAGATVRPEGALKNDALDVGRTLTHKANPYTQLVEVLRTPGSAKLDYAHDIAPWLGPHAGVFLSSLRSAGSLPTLLEHGLLGSSGAGASFPFGASAAQGAIVLDTSDSAKAKSFLETQAAHAGAHASSYRGVRFQTTAGGVAFGLVERFAVIGSESGLRAVIDTTHAAASALARQSSYGKLAAAAPAGALAHVYSNPAAATGAGAAEGISGLTGLLAGAHPANISLVPTASSLALDADALTAGQGAQSGGLLSADPQAAQALAELPAESWLAIGLGHLGTTLAADTKQLQALTSLGSASAPTATPSAGLSLGSLLEGLLLPLRALSGGGAQATRQLTSWMGSGGVFASGSSLLELRAAIVISSNDASRSRAAVSALGAALRKLGATVAPVTLAGTEAAISAAITGLPLKVVIAAGRDSHGAAKFVLALGEPSVATALNPSATLSSSTARSAAASSLGEGIQPSLIVNVPTLLSLFEGVGLLEAPPISQFVPYLRATTTIAGGGRQLGSEATRFRLVAGLAQQSSGEGESSG